MQLHLVIPHAAWPERDVEREVVAGLALPALAWLIGRGAREKHLPLDFHSWLAQRYGLPALPVAPLTLALDAPGEEAGYWLRADPVHLRANRDQLTLSDAAPLAIRPDEAAALVEALNRLLAEDGLRLIAPTPTRWYLCLPRDPGLETTPLHAVIGRDIHPALPRGADALQWHRLLNEIQMLLYTHPVNDARFEAGQPQINSLWLWGGGESPLPSTPEAPSDTVYTADPLVAALTAAGKGRVEPPAGVDELSATGMVVLDQLADPAGYGDAYAWREAWLALERDWFAPLAARLRRGELEEVALTFPELGLAVETGAGARWRFWRGARLPWSR
ncbi:hypothetical protein GCM10007860_12370 [Chitiniphilus shinanonensis]|uniref:Phosphoglycerate mutase n=1 Tax=Chitiniphilus shinanonensis TaxID=553088 RepID=A0ABQ6BU65_9NEIS|nr:hypothetical protein [Chitiniphilus shinanonensis]GLS04091.1 hypothetical protein GCM10007860_12370 [Chitiniphilus shinanonensis]